VKRQIRIVDKILVHDNVAQINEAFFSLSILNLSKQLSNILIPFNMIQFFYYYYFVLDECVKSIIYQQRITMQFRYTPKTLGKQLFPE
jgi:hypothetical protein